MRITRRQLLLILLMVDARVFFRSMASCHQTYKRSIASYVWNGGECTLFKSALQHSLKLAILIEALAVMKQYQALLSTSVLHTSATRSQKFSHGLCLLFTNCPSCHTCQVRPPRISIFTWIPADDFALLAQSLDHRQYQLHLY